MRSRPSRSLPPGDILAAIASLRLASGRLEGSLAAHMGLLDGMLGDVARHSSLPGLAVRIGLVPLRRDGIKVPAFVWLSDSHVTISGGPAASGDELLRSLVLRLVASNPSGTIRLTLIDPLGSGQGLSTFLVLPPGLRSERVLTGSAEIERRLETLASECEDVLQSRLGTQYASLDAYNVANPAIAQPYHIVAILGLPAGDWTEPALRQLRRLARNGPRAGFFIVATLDPAAPLPRGIGSLDDVLGSVARLTLDDAGLGHFEDPELRDFPFIPDVLPEPAAVAAQLSEIDAGFGQHSALSSEDVLVSLDWSASTANGLAVPIGIDLNDQPAIFRLGTGTMHNALVGGMVGSGKTNFLLLLIDQLASHYSPDELELYLLDLKEGVSFVDYLRLPHARAVNQATEREFALSALRHLRSQIEARGARFREAGVQQFADFRARGGAMPRLLLVVDEFQVLVSEDDALSREAGAILEDLVRRGRGFGVHVLLASQTPSGTYLSRVYEQMPLRIAFKSSDATSVAVLGEGNTAAGRLEQPGEAIANEEFGHAASNRRLRIALLPEDEHRSRISAIAALDGGAHPAPATFDGMSAASLVANPRLLELMAGTWRPEPGTSEAFLGEPVELTSPTAARFERYPRSNLLIVGPDEIDAYGLLEAAIVSLALEQPDAAFYVLDFARPSAPVAGVLAELEQRLPDQVSIAGPRQAGDALGAAIADLEARLAGGTSVDGSCYFIVAGLHRWRELRGTDIYKPTADGTALLVTVHPSATAGNKEGAGFPAKKAVMPSVR